MISPVATSGYVEVVEELGQVQEKVYERPTVLVAGRVLGEEEIPEGAVALLTPDMPDILSHVSVRARNSKVGLFLPCFLPQFGPFLLLTLLIPPLFSPLLSPSLFPPFPLFSPFFSPQVCFATCFDENILNELKQLHGKPISLKPTPNADLNFRWVFPYCSFPTFLSSNTKS